MKNPTNEQLAALSRRAKAASHALARAGQSKQQSGGGLSPEEREAFSSAAERVLRRNRAVGAAIVLCHPGGAEDAFFFGHARLRPRIPVGKNTCFRVASVSKLAMTFGALSLVQDGLLELDADIGGLLGSPVRHPLHPDAPVTLRMLLTHTAGIRDEGPYGTRGMQPGCTLRELLDDPACWAQHRPGEAFHYSNLSAGVAGVAMERAANIPLDDIMQARVFGPLGIRASFDPRRIAPADDLADGYSVRALFPPRQRYDAAALAARAPEPFDPERDYLCAPGRMITDAHGIARLARLLASHGELGVLRDDMLKLMRAPQDGTGGIRHAGRGLNVAFLPGVFDGFSPVGHQGVAYGMCAELFADPGTGAAVCVMTNGVLLTRTPPLARAGFDLLALGFAAMRA